MPFKKYVHSDWFPVFLFLAGIALFGSGIHWFPSINMVGIVLVGLSGLLSLREDRGATKIYPPS